ncbi:hypothetical protein DB818_09890 [Xanthomonas perforans]|nr:hypothetical protein EIJ44_05510 [Xanthomonas perforans]TQT06403.1 hypothetical protein EII94_10500 [Xanthomonas perforans]TQT18844.1 hypothetical protein EIJ11_04590 [Xanthomonas perforans]TQT20923.1 hypothetical protein EIJ05_03795 [Xanthomonas perforans]TQT24700.1 hypothetical protein EIJ02_11485 [Xanthomonas perforans]
MSACPRAAVPAQRLQSVQRERPVALEKWQVQRGRQALRWPRALLVPSGHRRRQAQASSRRPALAQRSQARAVQRQPALFAQRYSPV